MSVEPIAPYLEPLRLSVHVQRPVAEAFELFTSGFGRWWPVATHSISQDKAVTCGIEPVVGGAVYEVNDSGERLPWGHVIAWEPPRRLVLFWHPDRDAAEGQEVEVRFEPDGRHARGAGASHRQKLGQDAEKAQGVRDGWRACCRTMSMLRTAATAPQRHRERNRRCDTLAVLASSAVTVMAIDIRAGIRCCGRRWSSRRPSRTSGTRASEEGVRRSSLGRTSSRA
jgi:uncharacterized protein YndB with AHSA1/START domain